MKVLMVLTSHDKLGNTGRKTGFWLEELAAPYYVFKDAGAQITLASPKGGRPPLDPKSNEPNFQTDITRRFEKDANANAQLNRTARLDNVKQEDYEPSSTPVATGQCGISLKTGTRLSRWNLPGGRQDVRGSPLNRRAAPCQDAGWQAARRGQDRDRVHQWRGRSGRIDESRALPCRRRNDEPRRRIFQVKDWGVHTVADGQLITGQNPASSGPAAKLLIDTLNKKAK